MLILTGGGAPRRLLCIFPSSATPPESPYLGVTVGFSQNFLRLLFITQNCFLWKSKLSINPSIFLLFGPHCSEPERGLLMFAGCSRHLPLVQAFIFYSLPFPHPFDDFCPVSLSLMLRTDLCPSNQCVKTLTTGTSLVVQWLRLHLSMQGVKVPSQVGEPRSHIGCGQKNKTQNRNNIVTSSIKT